MGATKIAAFVLALVMMAPLTAFSAIADGDDATSVPMGALSEEKSYYVRRRGSA